MNVEISSITFLPGLCGIKNTISLEVFIDSRDILIHWSLLIIYILWIKKLRILMKSYEIFWYFINHKPAPTISSWNEFNLLSFIPSLLLQLNLCRNTHCHLSGLCCKFSLLATWSQLVKCTVNSGGTVLTDFLGQHSFYVSHLISTDWAKRWYISVLTKTNVCMSKLCNDILLQKCRSTQKWHTFATNSVISVDKYDFFYQYSLSFICIILSYFPQVHESNIWHVFWRFETRPKCYLCIGKYLRGHRN